MADPLFDTEIIRKTKETALRVQLRLNGTGQYDNQTGVGFFDHMLDQFAYHSMSNLRIRCQGDLHIDAHHTVEDTGIVLGQALSKAAGNKAGIHRYGFCLLPMDDALIAAALDFSGRPYLNWDVSLPHGKVGDFDTELVLEFFRALVTHGGITLHVVQHSGHNTHHIIEAVFKATARALRQAVQKDDHRAEQQPSTKGIL